MQQPSTQEGAQSFDSLDLRRHSPALGPSRRHQDNHGVAVLQPAGVVFILPLVILVTKAMVWKRLCVRKRTKHSPVNIGDRRQVLGDGPLAGIPNRLQRLPERRWRIR